MKKNLKYIIFFIIILLLVSLFPYSGDDWAWGSQIGLDRLATFFSNYNGRYMGNLLVLVLTRSYILRNIVMSLTIFGICYFCSRITNENKKRMDNLFIIAAILLFIMPSDILRQSIVWTSGFSNYAVSILLSLIYVNFAINHQDNNKLITAISLLILGFISALFIEHLTIFNIVFATYIVIYKKIKKKKIYITNVTYLVGSIIGAIFMFTNGAYTEVANGTDTYRNVATSIAGIISKININYFDYMYKQLFSSNIILLSIITILLTAYFIKKNIPKKSIKMPLILINISYITYFIFKLINPSFNFLLKYTTIFEGIFTIIFFISIFISTLLIIQEKQLKYKLTLYLSCILVIDLPLLFVSPIGSRCFIAGYIFFILYILELIKYLFNKNIIYLDILYYGIFAIILAFYFNIYGYVTKVNYERINDCMKQIDDGKKEINIRALPYEDFIWDKDPTQNTVWNDRFKLFYNIDENINIYVKED